MASFPGDLSPESVRDAWYAQNRKGLDLARRLIRTGETPSVHLRALASNYTAATRASKKRREIRRLGGPPAAMALAEARIESLRMQRKRLVEQLSGAIAAEINSPSFEIDFRLAFHKSGKAVFEYGPLLATNYFASKLIESDIRNGVSPLGRDDIVARVGTVLSDNLPKIVLRADIKSFYESISHDQLLSELAADERISSATIRLTRKLLARYSTLTGRVVGLPRGLGASAALAEAFLAPFDLQILSDPNTMFYARYVDDIVVVQAETPVGYPNGLDWLSDMLAGRALELSPKSSKRYEHRLDRATALPPFEYLGYRISFSGAMKVEMSARREDRIRRRLALAFEAYHRGGRSPRAAELLVKRVRFLTSNTRLTSNKNRAFVGIRFSNRHLTDVGQLLGLDRYLAHLTAGVTDPGLITRLGKQRFEAGFAGTHFVRWSGNDLKALMRVWRTVD